MPCDLEVITIGGGPLAVVQGVSDDWSIFNFKVELQAKLPEDKKGLPLKLLYNGHVLNDQQTMTDVHDSPLVAVFESLGFEHVNDLRSSDARKRCAAAEALGKLGAPAAPHVTCLAPLVCDKYGHVKSAAVTALKSIGAAGGPYVMTLLYSTDGQEQCAGAEALVVMGIQSEYVAEIAELLQSSNQKVRACAVKVIASMGASAAPHVAKLVALLRNPKVLKREYIPQAISHIGAPAIPHVAKLLCDEDPKIRSHAAQILGRIGPPAAHHATDLEQLLQDPEEQVKCSAIQGLTGMNVMKPVLDHLQRSNAEAIIMADQEQRPCSPPLPGTSIFIPLPGLSDLHGASVFGLVPPSVGRPLDGARLVPSGKDGESDLRVLQHLADLQDSCADAPGQKLSPHDKIKGVSQLPPVQINTPRELLISGTLEAKLTHKSTCKAESSLFVPSKAVPSTRCQRKLRVGSCPVGGR